MNASKWKATELGRLQQHFAFRRDAIASGLLPRTILQTVYLWWSEFYAPPLSLSIHDPEIGIKRRREARSSAVGNAVPAVVETDVAGR